MTTEPMTTDSPENSAEVGIDVQRLVSGYCRPIKIKWKSGLTQGELQKEIMRRLMGTDKYPQFGYKPCDVQDRVSELLNIEAKYRQLQKLLSANDKLNHE